MMPLVQSTVFEGLAGGRRGIRVVSTGKNINSGATINGNFGSGGIAGDFVISACLPGTGGDVWTPPSGWTERLESNTTADLEICTRAWPVTDNVFTYGYSASIAQAGAVFRNADYDTTGSAGSVSGAGTLTVPGVTLSKAGEVVVAIGSTGVTVTHAAPDASWERIEQQTGSGYPTVSLYRKAFSAGATGSVNFTIGGGIPGASAGAMVGIVKS